MGWMYFCLMGLLAILLGAFGSVFNTYSGLYLSKDNDLLLSMPIPVRSIMVSRLLGVYLMGLMYSAVVILPAIIVYWVTAPLTPSIVIGSLLFVLLISVLVLILSCVLGWVVAKISLKLKHKSFMTALIALVCLGAYYFFYFKAQAILQDLVANALLYGIHVKSAAYPLYLFGRYAEGDWTAIAVFTLATAALFALLWYVLSRSFLGIVTATGKAVRRVYREKAVQRQSISQVPCSARSWTVHCQRQLYAQLRPRHSAAAGRRHCPAGEGQYGGRAAGRTPSPSRLHFPFALHRDLYGGRYE